MANIAGVSVPGAASVNMTATLAAAAAEDLPLLPAVSAAMVASHAAAAAGLAAFAHFVRRRIDLAHPVYAIFFQVRIFTQVVHMCS